MSVEQQKGTSNHGDGGDGGTETSPHGQQQAHTAFDSQRALTSHWMEQVCDPQNIVRAYRRVRSNKGKPGVDGMTVHELADWLRNNQETLKASLLDGTYGPNRCVEYSFQSRKEDSVSWAFRWLSIASYSKRFCKC